MGAPGESTGRDFSKIRLILYAVECVFSLVVLITAAIVIDKGYGGWSQINFALFVGLTYMLLAAFYCFRIMKAPANKVLNLIELISLAIYWVFWLSAAAATADFVSGVNSIYWGGAYYDDIYGGYSTARDSARACCAFCWLTWALVSGSVALAVIEDVMQKKMLSSTKSTAPPAGDAPAAPAAPATDLPVEYPAPVPEAMAKV